MRSRASAISRCFPAPAASGPARSGLRTTYLAGAYEMQRVLAAALVSAKERIAFRLPGIR